MTAGTTRGRRALAVVLGFLIASVPALLFVPAAHAAAALVTVEIDAVSVTGSTPSDRVVLQATITNTSEAPVYGVRWATWRSRDPLLDAATLRSGAANSVPGFTLYGSPTSFGKVTEQTVALEPGASARVQLQAGLAELGWDTVGAAYPVGLRVLGTVDASATYVQIGEARTVVAIPGATPVGVTRVVVLSATPTKLTTNLFRNEDLRDELNGRLSSLLAAAEVPGTSYLIDPALIDELTDMADGYQVGDGQDTVVGAGSAAAAAWLARFGKLNPAAGARSLFANPDLTGAAAIDDPEVLARALTATEAVSQLANLPLVVLPTDAVHSTELADYLADAPVRAVLATNIPAAAAWQPGPSGLPVLAATPSLSDDETTDAFTRGQLLQAEAVVAGASGQLRLIRDAADVVADRLATATWMTPRLIAQLVAVPPEGQEAVPDSLAVSTLDEDAFHKIADLEQFFAAYGQLVPGSTIPDEAAAVLTRLASSAWVDDPDGRKDALGVLVDQVGPKALEKAVTLDASPRFVMSAKANEFPVTVTNNLAEAVRIKVVMEADNPHRLTVPPTSLVTIAAGQSQTLNVRPQAIANGVVLARAWVSTEGGRRVTPYTRITVEVTDLGFIGVIIVIVSSVVLLGATALRVRQVRRKATADAAAAAGAAETGTPEPADD